MLPAELKLSRERKHLSRSELSKQINHRTYKQTSDYKTMGLLLTGLSNSKTVSIKNLVLIRNAYYSCFTSITLSNGQRVYTIFILSSGRHTFKSSVKKRYRQLKYRQLKYRTNLLFSYYTSAQYNASKNMKLQ